MATWLLLPLAVTACGATGTDALGDGGSSGVITMSGAGGSAAAHAGHGGGVAAGSAGSLGAPSNVGGSGTAGSAGHAGASNAKGGASGATSTGGSAGNSGSSNGGAASGNGASFGGANALGGAGSGAANGGVSSGGNGGSATSGSAGKAGATSGQGGGTAGAGGSVPTDSGNCATGTQLVYVFTLDNEIWSFNPPTKAFTKVASLDCASGLTANSMAIDRNLVAWLNYFDEEGDGAIYTYDLKTKASCKDSGITLPDGFTQIGMGFSTDVAGGSTETLYIDGIGGQGLAKIDMASKSVVPIGSFGNDSKLSDGSAELTGTGDARLFGYFTTDPVRVAEIDKTNGNILSDVPLKGVSPPSDWAFSFWGGEFYLYAAPGNNGNGNSTVIQYDPATNAVDKSYVADTGFIIIGAGVSTCAPTEKP